MLTAFSTSIHVGGFNAVGGFENVRAIGRSQRIALLILYQHVRALGIVRSETLVAKNRIHFYPQL